MQNGEGVGSEYDVGILFVAGGYLNSFSSSGKTCGALGKAHLRSRSVFRPTTELQEVQRLIRLEDLLSAIVVRAPIGHVPLH